MTLAAMRSRLERLRASWQRVNGTRLLLVTTFLLVSGSRTLGAIQFGLVGVDARVYREAAVTLIGGGDPWAPTGGLVTFGGTPPSLVAFLPAALLPEMVAVPLYLGLFAIVGVLLLRRLSLPLWWLAFPPLWESILVVNQDVLVVWLLVLTGLVAGLAVVCKTYAAVPLALQGRWRPLAVGVVLSLLLLPWWLEFWNRRQEISATLLSQAEGGLSAWGTWWLFVPTVIALLGHGASWLTVPALWPATQLHYSLLALPVARRSPILAFLLCFSNPWVPAIAVIVECLRIRVWPLVVARWAASPAPLPEPSP
jgi:hypothetical protein